MPAVMLTRPKTEPIHEVHGDRREAPRPLRWPPYLRRDTEAPELSEDATAALTLAEP